MYTTTHLLSQTRICLPTIKYKHWQLVNEWFFLFFFTWGPSISERNTCLTVAVTDHGQQLLNGAAEHGLLPLQDTTVVRGAAQLALESDNQPTLSLHQLVELPLLALQAPQLSAVASLQRQQPLLQEAAEIKQAQGMTNTVWAKIPLQMQLVVEPLSAVYTAITQTLVQWENLTFNYETLKLFTYQLIRN